MKKRTGCHLTLDAEISIVTLSKRLEREAIRPSWRLALALTLTVLAIASIGQAQQPRPEPAFNPKAMVQLTLPPETEIKTLIDLVSQRLGIQFLYDEHIVGKKISINSPKPIPAETLLDVLGSALKMKGLALVDGEIPGWKRIVVAEDLPQIAVPSTGQRINEIPGTVAVTQTFQLAYLPPDRVAKIIEPFLTKKGANVVILADKNMLIVTDYAPNLVRIARLIELIDQTGPDRILKFQKIAYVDAGEIAQQVTAALAARAASKTPGNPPLTILPDKRTNQVLMVGTRLQIEEAQQLLRAFDVPLEQRTQVYRFRYVDAERIDRLVKQSLDPLTVEHLFHSAVDKADNLLIVTGPERVHERIDQLRKELDVEIKRSRSGVQFYRLKYADAQDVLNTLRALEQRSGGPGESFQSGVSALGRGGVGTPSNLGPQTTPVTYVPGANTPDQVGGPPAYPPAQQPVGSSPTAGPAGSGALVNPTGTVAQGAPVATAPGALALAGAAATGAGTIVPGAARVSIDAKSNSIIVIADPAVQLVYEDLIRRLDRPRPQVMIEAKIVVLDTSDDYSLGVEISAGATHGAAQILQFTSFGLSTVNPVTGALALIPGQGFNWSLIDPNAADAVIRAMANHSRSKVLSAPRLLVADNAVGTLASVQEVPFTSVNASTTVATTSFAGFAEAGTTIQVTPRIMDDDHLQLQFNVALNSFTGTGSAGVPPPRQTDQIASRVTIPNGYTLIVGGLKNRNKSWTSAGLPFTEFIPVLRDLTSLQTWSYDETTLFIFLRPTILTDDKFRDLKYLSDQALPCALEPGNIPVSGPLLIR